MENDRCELDDVGENHKGGSGSGCWADIFKGTYHQAQGLCEACDELKALKGGCSYSSAAEQTNRAITLELPCV